MDKDCEEAFNEWELKNNGYDGSPSLYAWDSWQACWEHRQKEIDHLVDMNAILNLANIMSEEKNKTLKAQLEVAIEVLKKISSANCGNLTGDVANFALVEIEGLKNDS